MKNMTRRGSNDQRAEHKEERVWTREAQGEDKAAETEKKEDFPGEAGKTPYRKL